jgi:hypothetical protein
MKMNRKSYVPLAAFFAFALISAGCAGTSDNDAGGPADSAPKVIVIIPADRTMNVNVYGEASAVFSESMDSATITAANCTLETDSVAVTVTVTYDDAARTVVLKPVSNLLAGRTYTATIKTGARDSLGKAMAEDRVWSFTTAVASMSPSPVLLGTAGDFAILAKTAISTVPSSVIIGDIGVSPVAETYLTGFSQTKFTGYSTSPQVTGKLYAADMTPPTPLKMTTAVSDMETAYTDAAGRPTPDFTNLFAGNIGGLTLVPGLYTWDRPC